MAAASGQILKLQMQRHALPLSRWLLPPLMSQVVVHGLPIRPAFSKRQPPRRKLRKQLGLRRAGPAVLLVGGGEGMGPVERTVNAIAAGPGAKVQLVVVCGRNEKLVKRLSDKVLRQNTSPASWLTAS